jgi:hypothetical protein
MPQQVRSTDAPFAKPAPSMIVDAASAREAALASVKQWCGWCNGEIVRGRHRCTVSDEVKRMHAEGAKRELAALSKFPVPDCIHCGRTNMKPGESHDCVLDRALFPHEVAAAQWAARQHNANTPKGQP